MMAIRRFAPVMGLLFVLLFAPYAPANQRSSGGDAGPQGDTEVPFRTIDKGFASHVHYSDDFYHGEERVIRDDPSWEAFWYEHENGTIPMPPPPTNISWGEEMVLVAIQGLIATCCSAHVNFTHMDREGDVLHAYLETSWNGGRLCAVSNPYHIVAVESAPTVIFEGGHGSDVYPPEGSIVIDGGNSMTETQEVTLSLTYSDVGRGVSRVRYSNDGSWDDEYWESPIPTKSWTLTSGDGVKTVYYQIIDHDGLLSFNYSDSIQLVEYGHYVARYEPPGTVRCTNCTWVIVLESDVEIDPTTTYGVIPMMAHGGAVKGAVAWIQEGLVASHAPLRGL